MWNEEKITDIIHTFAICLSKAQQSIVNICRLVELCIYDMIQLKDWLKEIHVHLIIRGGQSALANYSGWYIYKKVHRSLMLEHWRCTSL